MKFMLKLVGIVVVVVLVLAAGALVYLRSTGLSARGTPSALETRVARAARAAAIPREDRQRHNPVPASAEALADGMAHFADHCATCHGNDGRGDTDFGRGLFPKPPDMRAAATQGLTDGELFYIIENGVRFTGMPAFGSGDGSGAEDTWRLVHFIRAVPRLTPDQIAKMEALNPRSPEEIRQQIAEEESSTGGKQPPPHSKPHRH
ncbi:MAG: c-type cytochrome [Vicinamibacterales bacterium]